MEPPYVQQLRAYSTSEMNRHAWINFGMKANFMQWQKLLSSSACLATMSLKFIELELQGNGQNYY